MHSPCPRSQEPLDGSERTNQAHENCRCPKSGEGGRKRPLVCVLLWAALLLALWWLFPRRAENVRRGSDGGSASVMLPWFGKEVMGEQRFQAGLIAPVKSLSIRADDCVERLEIDGRVVFAGEPGECLHCAYTRFSIPGGLAPGKHLLDCKIKNLRGEAWFDIKERHGFTASKVVLLFLWGAAAFWAVRRCGCPGWVGWPLAIAGLLALQYLDVTTPWVRQHDVWAHREYIDFIASRWALPLVEQGWETWQPPLYYGLAAVWRWGFSPLAWEDAFRPVQFLAGALYLGTIFVAVPVFRRLRLNSLEAFAGLAALAFPPSNLFFAGRISNDTLLPLLGAAVLWVTAEFARSGERRWLRWLAVLLPLTLMAKGSSLAIAGGALLVVFWTELSRAGWRRGLLRAYLAGLPAGVWQLLWCARNVAQTGRALYVNTTLLPEGMRLHQGTLERLFSLNLAAFLGGAYHYDGAIRGSYPAAMLTSALYGEYAWNDYGVEWSNLLRYGLLGLMLVLLAGAAVRPRPELRPVWIASLCLAGCQVALVADYAMQYPFACNQNVRFLAQAFVPFAVLFGLGASHFWERGGWKGRSALAVTAGAFGLGLAQFYWRLLF